LSVTVEDASAAGRPPLVGITVAGLSDATTSVVTLDVTWDGGLTWHPVRGATGMRVIGAGYIRDYVPPLNVPATYRLTVQSPAGVPPATATITLAAPNLWVQDPLDPSAGFEASTTDMRPGLALLELASLSEATWKQTVDLVLPLGASTPVGSVGQRSHASDVKLTVAYDEATDDGSVRRTLMASGVVTIRGLPVTHMLDAVDHLALGDAVERRVRDTRQTVTLWDLTGTVVRAPGQDIVVPFWTYADVFNLWAGQTYAQAMAARPGQTYLQWLRDPRRP
jgi:hypothetical protein